MTRYYEELVSQEEERQAGDWELYIPLGPRLGETVIEAREISNAFGDKVLLEQVSFGLPRGGIGGVIGPNGAGKTTLFRMMTWPEEPDAGSLGIGKTVRLGYADQTRALDDQRTVWEAITARQDSDHIGQNGSERSCVCRTGSFHRIRSAKACERPVRM